MRSIFIAGFMLSAFSAHAQSGNACDLNKDGKVDAVDVQAAINGTLGLSPCNANINGVGVCNIVVVQRVVNASTGGACLSGTPVPHSASLSWNASTSSNVAAYKVYRGTVSGGPYTLITTLGLVTAYVDNTVQAGNTYYYVATAVGGNGAESIYSNQAQAVIPTP